MGLGQSKRTARTPYLDRQYGYGGMNGLSSLGGYGGYGGNSGYGGYGGYGGNSGYGGYGNYGGYSGYGAAPLMGLGSSCMPQTAPMMQQSLSQYCQPISVPQSSFNSYIQLVPANIIPTPQPCICPPPQPICPPPPPPPPQIVPVPQPYPVPVPVPVPVPKPFPVIPIINVPVQQECCAPQIPMCPPQPCYQQPICPPQPCYQQPICPQPCSTNYYPPTNSSQSMYPQSQFNQFGYGQQYPQMQMYNPLGRPLGMSY